MDDDDDGSPPDPTGADLALSLIASPSSAIAGNELSYTLKIINWGPTDATNVTIIDTLPPGVSFVSADSGRGATCSGTSTVTCSLGSLANGESHTITLRVAVSPSIRMALNNSAAVTASEADPNPANNVLETTTPTEAQSNLKLSLTDSADPVVAGSALTYTLSLTNTGPSEATGIVVTNTLPISVTLNSASNGCTEFNGTITCTQDILAVGVSEKITITVTTSPTIQNGSIIINTATISGTETDLDSINNTTSESTTIDKVADLAITKVGAPNPVTAGESLTYTLTVTNFGPSDASNVTVTDHLPDGVTLASAPPGCSESANIVTCLTAALPAGNMVQHSLVVTVSPVITDLVVNQAAVTGDEADPVSGNNTTTMSTTVNIMADLSITKQASPDPVQAGGIIAYSLVITNNGPSEARNVVVSDALPDSVTVANVTPISTTQNGNMLNWVIPALAAGASQSVAIDVIASDHFSGIITNTASAIGSDPDQFLINNMDQVTITVTPVVTLVVNTEDDIDDGTCSTIHCSLQEAINASNANATITNTIAFSIPGPGPHTIVPATPLPTVTVPVVIDATTEPGASCASWPPTLLIELDGSIAGFGNGLTIFAGDTTVRGLVINRFKTMGVLLDASGGNLLECNFIGTDLSGYVDLGNGSDGIQINGVPSNTIGGLSPSARNLISGNDQDGIDIKSSGAKFNLIQGNFVGTNVDGTAAIRNSSSGIEIDGWANNNTIGGNVPAARNLISGNGDDGLKIAGFGTNDNLVQGNYIGTDITGLAALGNENHGIYIRLNASNNRIGGVAPGQRNLIAGNLVDGIRLSDIGTTNNIIEGNYIGTNAAGTAAIGNLLRGIRLDTGAAGNLIGGTDPGARNLISGNNEAGVQLTGIGTNDNVIKGNYIGTDISGALALGNGLRGVQIRDGAANNTIGGPQTGAGNVISANGKQGVRIAGNLTTGNIVQGNLIGTDQSGLIDLGNAEHGVNVALGASGNIVGGSAPGEGNIISGNDFHGVRIAGNGSGNIVQGNIIGADIGGSTPLGNAVSGVRIITSTNNTVGGAVSGAGNIIAFNGASGLNLGNTVSNTLRSNRIFGNSTLGIDLNNDGLTLNDPGDIDPGANNLQNYPVLNGITDNGSTIDIGGDLNSTPNTSFTLEFFANITCDPSGYGEGETPLLTSIVTTDGSGNASFNVPTAAPVGQFITATATDPTGNTSEFSACASFAAPIDISVDNTVDSNPIFIPIIMMR